MEIGCEPKEPFQNGGITMLAIKLTALNDSNGWILDYYA